MGRVSQHIVRTTVKRTTTKTVSSKAAAAPKSAQHPVDCCVHKTHSKK